MDNVDKAKLSLQLLGDVLDRMGEALDTPVDQHRLVIDASIQRFKFTVELLWKTLSRFLALEGLSTQTPRETLKQAYALKWLHDESLWLRMLTDRNLTSHTYRQAYADQIYQHIKAYYPKILEVYQMLDARKDSYDQP